MAYNDTIVITSGLQGRTQEIDPMPCTESTKATSYRKHFLGEPLRPCLKPGPKAIFAKPWKYRGYRVFSRWLASDPSFLIIRRFGALQARTILLLQDDITLLEEKIDYVDGASLDDGDDHGDNGSFRYDRMRERKQLMSELTIKLKEYNSFVNEYSLLMSRPKARPQDVANVRYWLGVDKGPSVQPIQYAEAAFITRDHDLIAVSPKDISWFRKMLEKSMVLKMPFVRSCVEKKPEDIEDYEDIKGIRDVESGKIMGSTIWQNDKRIDHCSMFAIIIVGLGMLICPLWILKQVDIYQPDSRMACITGFIVAFFLMVKVATTARVFDAMAATAAYAAVLMVFMQMGSDKNGLRPHFPPLPSSGTSTLGKSSGDAESGQRISCRGSRSKANFAKALKQQWTT